MKRFPFQRHEFPSILGSESPATDGSQALSSVPIPATAPAAEAVSIGTAAAVRRQPVADKPADILDWLDEQQAALEQGQLAALDAGEVEETSTNTAPSPSLKGNSSGLAVPAAAPVSNARESLTDVGAAASPVSNAKEGLADVVPGASPSPESQSRRKLSPTEIPLNLLVPWQPAWSSFLSSIPPAFLRNTKPLAVEIRRPKFDPSSLAISVAAHVAILLVLIGGYQAHHASEVLLQAGGQRSYDVIYFSGPYLPPLEDRGGALIGVSGRSGGRELKHIQNIRVARGTKVAASTVDAPNLKLPHTDKAVANLLAVRPIAPSAPVQALRSVLAKLGFAPDVVPPAPRLDVAQRAAAPLPTEVVPPAPDTASLPQKTAAHMKIDAVPAPVSAPVRDSNAMARLRLPAEVVAPPPSGISRTRALPHGMGGSPQVAPPPPNLAAVNSGSPNGSPNGLGSADVVPPPPSASEIADGALNSTLNAISNAVRAAGMGSTDAPGVIASAHPGKDVAIPNSAGAGELALSTTGGDKLGLGGSGGGTGIGNGTGPGNAPAGKGPGSGIADIGPGAASGRGNSPSPGDGGAGSSPTATSSSGVWVASRFPNGSVSLPSFSNSGNAPSPGHSPADPRRRKPGVTIVGTSRSGGALNQYGALPGSRVYTVYIDTDAGTAVLQYSSADTSGKEFSQDLVAPEAVRAEVPADLRSAKFVVACVVDRSGLLRNLRVLQNSSPGALGQLLSMLHEWRFRPVLRGNAAIEVNAIVGFNIDTR